MRARGLRMPLPVANARRHAPIVYTTCSKFVHRIELREIRVDGDAVSVGCGDRRPAPRIDSAKWAPESCRAPRLLGRDNAHHACQPGFDPRGEAAVAKRGRYPLRIEPKLSVRADLESPGAAVPLMQHVMDAPYSRKQVRIRSASLLTGMKRPLPTNACV
jgi:hypothetical protein